MFSLSKRAGNNTCLNIYQNAKTILHSFDPVKSNTSKFNQIQTNLIQLN